MRFFVLFSSLVATAAAAAHIGERAATPAICGTLNSCYARFTQSSTASAYCSNFLVAATKSVTTTTTLSASTLVKTKIVTVRGTATIPQTSVANAAASYVTSYQPCTSATTTPPAADTGVAVRKRQATSSPPGCLQYMVGTALAATSSACQCIVAAQTSVVSITKTVTPKTSVYTWTGTVNLQSTVHPVSVATVTPTYTETMDPLPCALTVTTSSGSGSTSTPTPTAPPTSPAAGSVFPTLGCASGSSTPFTTGTLVFNYCISLYAYGSSVSVASNPYPTDAPDCAARYTDGCVGVDWAAPKNCYLNYGNIYETSVFSSWNPIWTPYILVTTLGASPTAPATTAPSTPTTTSTTTTPSPTTYNNQGLQYEVFTDISTYWADDTYQYFESFIGQMPHTVPQVTGITTTIGGFYITSPINGNQTTIYNSTQFDWQYFAVNHQGYIVPYVTGTYTFTSDIPDDYLAVWVGPNAVSNWTTDNANGIAIYGSQNNVDNSPINFSMYMNAGQYYPFRAIYSQSAGAAVYNFYIADPAGYYFAATGQQGLAWIQQYSCDGTTAPPLPGWATSGTA